MSALETTRAHFARASFLCTTVSVTVCVALLLLGSDVGRGGARPRAALHRSEPNWDKTVAAPPQPFNSSDSLAPAFPSDAALAAACAAEIARPPRHAALRNRCCDNAWPRAAYVAATGRTNDEDAVIAFWAVTLGARGVPVLVYEKSPSRVGNATHVLPGDVQKEESVYLSYLVGYYDCLPPAVLLLHANAGSHVPQLKQDLACMRDAPLPAANNASAPLWMPITWRPGGSSGYFRRKADESYVLTSTGVAFIQALFADLSAIGGWEIPRVDLATTFGSYCCAQFIVSRAAVRRWPRAAWAAVYEFAYDVAHATNTSRFFTPDAGQTFEHNEKTRGWTPAAILEFAWNLFLDHAPEGSPQPLLLETGHEATTEERCAFFPPGCGPCPT